MQSDDDDDDDHDHDDDGCWSVPLGRMHRFRVRGVPTYLGETHGGARPVDLGVIDADDLNDLFVRANVKLGRNSYRVYCVLAEVMDDSAGDDDS